MQQLPSPLLNMVCSFCTIAEHFTLFSRVCQAFKQSAQHARSFPPSTSQHPHVLFKSFALSAIARGFRPEHLVLDGNVTKQDFRMLSRVSNLKHLEFSTEMESKSFSFLARYFPELETLLFFAHDDGTGWSTTENKISKKQIKSLAKCSALTDVDIYNVGCIDEQQLDSLLYFKRHKLRRFAYSSTNNTDKFQQISNNVYSKFAQEKMPLTEMIFEQRGLDLSVLSQFPLEQLSLDILNKDSQLSVLRMVSNPRNSISSISLTVDPTIFSKLDLEILVAGLKANLKSLNFIVADSDDKKQVLFSDDLQEFGKLVHVSDLDIEVPEDWPLDFFSAFSQLRYVKKFTYPSNHLFTRHQVNLLGEMFVSGLKFLDLDYITSESFDNKDLHLLNYLTGANSIFIANCKPLVTIESIKDIVTRVPIGCVMEVSAQDELYCIIYTADGWKTSSNRQISMNYADGSLDDPRDLLHVPTACGEIDLS